MRDLLVIVFTFLVNVLVLGLLLSGAAVILLFLFNYIAASLNHGELHLTFGTSLAVVFLLALLGRIIRGPSKG